MFSIIIPLYNKSAYVAKAIQSVAAQTYQEFELIIIDDGSTDQSSSIAKNALSTLFPPSGGQGANPLRDWRAVQQQNQGVSTTRNNGVKLAKYDYIAFLDADDWWEPTFLEEMKALLEEFPEAGIYGSSYYKVRNGKFIIPNIGVKKGFTKDYIDYFKVYAKTMWMPLWTGAVVIPKKIYEEFNGFRLELKMGEDFHLWVRIADNYKVAFLNKQLSNYNQDVEVANRAVDEKLYHAHEHMLFADYSFIQNKTDFTSLFEVLAVYGLMPYYLAKKNKVEVKKILKNIHWENHAFKYRLMYRILPRLVVKWWYRGLKISAKLKKSLTTNRK